MNTNDADGRITTPATMAELVKALTRAEVLLSAAQDWAYRAVDYYTETVFYDGTDCDGLCLSDDCENAAINIRAVLEREKGDNI